MPIKDDTEIVSMDEFKKLKDSFDKKNKTKGIEIFGNSYKKQGKSGSRNFKKLKIICSFSQFKALGGASADLKLFRLPPLLFVNSFFMNVEVSWAGTSMTAITLSAGQLSNPAGIFPVTSVLSTGIKSGSGSDITNNKAVYSMTNYTDIYLECKATGNTLDALTAGIVSVFIIYG